MQTQFEQMYQDLQREYPCTAPKLTTFPSGAAMLDIEIDGKGYVVEYLPSKGMYGISRLESAVFGWEGFENAFHDFETVRKCIFDVLKEKYG